MRPWRAEDVPAAVRAARDPAIGRFSHLPDLLDDAAVAAWIEGMPAEREAGQALRLIVADASRPSHLRGAIALFDVRGREQGEVGYWIEPGSRGRGLAGRAVSLLSRWAFEVFGLGGLVARVDPPNVASRRVLLGCGFVDRGRADGKLVLRLSRPGLGFPN